MSHSEWMQPPSILDEVRERRAEAIARFTAVARVAPNGDLRVFDQDLVTTLEPWKAALIRQILDAPADEALVLTRLGPDRRNWRRRF